MNNTLICFFNKDMELIRDKIQKRYPNADLLFNTDSPYDFTRSMQLVSSVKREIELKSGREYDWCIGVHYNLMNHNDNYFDLIYSRSIKNDYAIFEYGIYLTKIYYGISPILFKTNSYFFDRICEWYHWKKHHYSEFTRIYGSDERMMFYHFLKSVHIDIEVLGLHNA